MSFDAAPALENRPLQIYLIDTDPLFRQGLQLWLSQTSDMEVVDVSNDVESWLGRSPLNSTDALPLVLLGLEAEPFGDMGFALLQRIRAQYPSYPVLVLGTRSEPVLVAAAQGAGASGYVSKNLPVDQLERTMRQVARGRASWTTWLLEGSQNRTPTAPMTTDDVGLLAIARRNLRVSGLRRIDTVLADVTRQLKMRDLSLWEQAILAGRRRELRASRWLVSHLLATPALPEPEPSPPAPPPGATASPGATTSTVGSPPPPAALVQTTTEDLVEPRSLQGVLFDTALTKLQGGLLNLSDRPMELDILRDDKKRELLYLILRKLGELLSELRYAQFDREQVFEKRSLILRDLWRAIVIDFFGRYYTITVQGQETNVTDVILRDELRVQEAILERIPLVADWLAHGLMRSPLIVDGVPYAPGTPDAMVRAEVLLDNLMVQLGNAVVQPLLNRFGDTEVIKQSFYDRRLLSSREIERFRNDLSWNYRLQRYFQEPQDIFESQYRVLTLQGRGIKAVSIYAPRRDELDQLDGVQWAVTFALETRDAIAPRVRTALSVVGSGVVYVLTEVIGRGIGLIGRGILRAIGNTRL